MSEEIHSNKDDDGKVTLNLSLDLDRELFLRRTCPKCGLDFKTKANDAEIGWLLREEINRQGAELGISTNNESDEDLISKLCCPYCHSIFGGNKSFTEDQIAYSHQHIYREVISPMMHKMFSDMADSINGGRRSSGGFLSISMSFDYEREALPPRPIQGPEPADMKIVEFLCCGEKAKILENWQDLKKCVFCQTEIRLV